MLAELIRVFHGVSLDEAQTAIDALLERKHPIVWEIERTKRVLDPQMHRLLEYDAPKYRARITPRGSKDVEDRILLKYKS